VGCKGAVGLRSSERVNDLANLIGKHLSRFLCVPSSSEPGVSIWYTLVWLTGAWCTALVVLRRSKSGKVGAAAALVAAVVTDGASSYLEKLLITFMGALTPVETALQAPNEDAALQHRGGAKNRTLGPDDHGSPRFAPNFALHALNHCLLDAYYQGLCNGVWVMPGFVACAAKAAGNGVCAGVPRRGRGPKSVQVREKPKKKMLRRKHHRDQKTRLRQKSGQTEHGKHFSVVLEGGRCTAPRAKS